MTTNNIVLMGCGDVGPLHEPMEPYSTLIRPTLAQADIRIAQCERVYSDLGSAQLHSGDTGSRRVKAHMASVFSDCGFDVVSMAGNHAMDWGEDALLDMLERFRNRGMQTVGAGRNIAEARQPAMIECNGVRVAVLAYCSVLNEGYAADTHKGGVAPLRAHTYYQAIENHPGVPPRVVTIPYDEDLSTMVDDITAAKKTAHVVVLSLHWGVHFIPRLIADYQTTVAKTAFKAGADLILGHHAHIPKAIGVESGKVCFYSLGNFIMSSPPKTGAQAAKFIKHYGAVLDPEYPHLAHGMDSKRSLIAKAVVSNVGVQKVSFLPVLIDKQLRPEALHRGDPRFSEAVSFMHEVSEGYYHKFTVENDEVLVTAP